MKTKRCLLPFQDRKAFYTSSLETDESTSTKLSSHVVRQLSSLMASVLSAFRCVGCCEISVLGDVKSTRELSASHGFAYNPAKRQEQAAGLRFRNNLPTPAPSKNANRNVAYYLYCTW